MFLFFVCVIERWLIYGFALRIQATRRNENENHKMHVLRISRGEDG